MSGDADYPARGPDVPASRKASRERRYSADGEDSRRGSDGLSTRKPSREHGHSRSPIVSPSHSPLPIAQPPDGVRGNDASGSDPGQFLPWSQWHSERDRRRRELEQREVNAQMREWYQERGWGPEFGHEREMGRLPPRRTWRVFEEEVIVPRNSTNDAVQSRDGTVLPDQEGRLSWSLGRGRERSTERGIVQNRGQRTERRRDRRVGGSEEGSEEASDDQEDQWNGERGGEKCVDVSGGPNRSFLPHWHDRCRETLALEGDRDRIEARETGKKRDRPHVDDHEVGQNSGDDSARARKRVADRERAHEEGDLTEDVGNGNRSHERGQRGPSRDSGGQGPMRTLASEPGSHDEEVNARRSRTHPGFLATVPSGAYFYHPVSQDGPQEAHLSRHPPQNSSPYPPTSSQSRPAVPSDFAGDAPLRGSMPYGVYSNYGQPPEFARHSDFDHRGRPSGPGIPPSPFLVVSHDYPSHGPHRRGRFVPQYAHYQHRYPSEFYDVQRGPEIYDPRRSQGANPAFGFSEERGDYARPSFEPPSYVFVPHRLFPTGPQYGPTPRSAPRGSASGFPVEPSGDHVSRPSSRLKSSTSNLSRQEGRFGDRVTEGGEYDRDGLVEDNENLPADIPRSKPDRLSADGAEPRPGDEVHRNHRPGNSQDEEVLRVPPQGRADSLVPAPWEGPSPASLAPSYPPSNHHYVSPHGHVYAPPGAVAMRYPFAVQSMGHGPFPFEEESYRSYPYSHHPPLASGHPTGYFHGHPYAFPSIPVVLSDQAPAMAGSMPVPHDHPFRERPKARSQSEPERENSEDRDGNDGSKPVSGSRQPPVPPRKAASSRDNSPSATVTTAARRHRLHWTPELHGRFVKAVTEIGIDSAVPKLILQHMGVHGLTRENVASHLQKFREAAKKDGEAGSKADGNAGDDGDRVKRGRGKGPQFNGDPRGDPRVGREPGARGNSEKDAAVSLGPATPRENHNSEQAQQSKANAKATE